MPPVIVCALGRRVYLDDNRKAPFGWERAHTADECIAFLEKGCVEELSLDHDLAEEHYEPSTGYADAEPVYREKTGMSVVEWMIDPANEGKFEWPRHIILHSMNPVGRERMKRALEAKIASMPSWGIVLEVYVGFCG